MVTAGAHGGPEATIDFHHLYDRRITIMGMPGHRAEDRDPCFKAAAEGKIKAQIEHVLPLSRAADAHRMVESGEAMGKIVLDPTMG
jgi:NADPH:quinone reductase-like Zn-dependent oxidoreductase